MQPPSLLLPLLSATVGSCPSFSEPLPDVLSVVLIVLLAVSVSLSVTVPVPLSPEPPVLPSPLLWHCRRCCTRRRAPRWSKPG
ncbi:MAG: hypothetical protein U0168_00330 [Nannocystaceae bacterium]